jgi:hypothetical protein
MRRVITEVGTIVTNDSSWHPESRKDVIPYKLANDLVVIALCGDGFSPLGHIVHSYEYVRVSI